MGPSQLRPGAMRLTEAARRCFHCLKAMPTWQLTAACLPPTGNSPELMGTVNTPGRCSPAPAGHADLIAYGRPFIANPDLPLRFCLDAPLNPCEE